MSVWHDDFSKLQALLCFAGELLTPWPECLESEFGCDLQESAERALLIEPRVLVEGDDLGEWDVGDTMFFLTPFGQEAIDAVEQARVAA